VKVVDKREDGDGEKVAVGTLVVVLYALLTSPHVSWSVTNGQPPPQTVYPDWCPE